MKRKLLLCLLASISIYLVNAQYSIVVYDDMTTGGKFLDNALKFTPDGYDSPVRAFKLEDRKDDNDLTFPSVTLTDTAMGEVPGLFRSWACFDYAFPDEIDRSDGDTIKIEFDMMWDLASAGSGESGRTNITLVSELPEGGITAENFGKPAYNIWLFNGTYTACMAYGGEFEVDPQNPESVPNPGWYTAADDYYYNHMLDHTASIYGTTPNYPEVPYSKNFSQQIIASQTQWKHYTWIIAPEMMHLLYRNTNEGPEADEEIVFMAIPEDPTDIKFINEVHGTLAAQMPPAYQWFDVVNGLRFFNRGAGRNEGDNNFNFTNLKITKTGLPVGTYAEFKGVRAVQRSDEGPFTLFIDITNPSTEEDTKVDVVLISGDSTLIDNYATQTLTFPAGSSESQELEINFTSSKSSGRDTLTFALQNPSGGTYAAIGIRKEYQLIMQHVISNIQSNFFNEVRIYPNPASDALRVRFENGDFIKARAEVFSLTGKLLLSKMIYSDNSIDLKNLKNGVYLLKIQVNDNVIRQKFTINR